MAALGLAVWNRDGTIDRSENERERGRYTVCFVFLPSGPECESGFHCSFLVWVDAPSPSLPLRFPFLSLSVRLSLCLILSRYLLSLASPSLSLCLSVCPCIRLSLALFCRSIPSRRTFKCHQPDREVGLDISLYRVCLKCLTSARVPLTGKKSCRVKIRRCYWDIYLLKRVSVLKLFVLWENLIDIFLLIWKIDANFLVLIFN